MQKFIRTWRPRQFREKTDFEMVVSPLIDWLIDWLLYSTPARGDTGFALVLFIFFLTFLRLFCSPIKLRKPHRCWATGHPFPLILHMRGDREWSKKGNFFTFELLSVVGIPVIFFCFSVWSRLFRFDLMIPDRGPVFLADKFGFFFVWPWWRKIVQCFLSWCYFFTFYLMTI